MKKNESTPILVANTHWDLPEIIVKEVKAERMINGLIDMVKPDLLSEEENVGWAECVAYLMPATQDAPLRGDVVDIYLYCVTKLMERRGTKVPKECRVDKLSDYQIKKLNEMKRWIYENRGGKENNNLLNALKEVFK